MSYQYDKVRENPPIDKIQLTSSDGRSTMYGKKKGCCTKREVAFSGIFAIISAAIAVAVVLVLTNKKDDSSKSNSGGGSNNNDALLRAKLEQSL